MVRHSAILDHGWNRMGRAMATSALQKSAQNAQKAQEVTFWLRLRV
jgi:hypothetical protein